MSQLLDLARAEAGMQNEARTEVELIALAEGVLFAMRAAHPRVEMDLIAPGSEVMILAVSARVESVLRNLIDNAASFSAQVTLEIVPDPSGVSIRVADRGPGIADEHAARLFERFFTTRAGGAGTGLGLALVKAVVVAHQGTVSARKRPEGGALFELWLPRVAG